MVGSIGITTDMKHRDKYDLGVAIGVIIGATPFLPLIVGILMEIFR